MVLLECSNWNFRIVRGGARSRSVVRERLGRELFIETGGLFSPRIIDSGLVDVDLHINVCLVD